MQKNIINYIANSRNILQHVGISEELQKRDHSELNIVTLCEVFRM